MIFPVINNNSNQDIKEIKTEKDNEIENLELQVEQLIKEVAELRNTNHHASRQTAPDIHNNEFHLSQNFPNPFSETTTFNYQIPKNQNASLHIIDASGKLVKQVVLNHKESNISVSTSDFTKGLYFGQIIVNGAHPFHQDD